MTVKELIAELRMCDSESLVVMSKDSEGNGFGPLAEVGISRYTEHSTWSGDLCSGELSDHDRDAGLTENDEYKNSVPAIVLWPIN